MENLYTQWVQQPQLLSDSSHQHETRPSATLSDDWSKDRSTTTLPTGGAGSPIAVGGTSMDISDFTTLGDMGGKYQLYLDSRPMRVSRGATLTCRTQGPRHPDHRCRRRHKRSTRHIRTAILCNPHTPLCRMARRGLVCLCPTTPV